jgi:hypothetical protein
LRTAAEAGEREAGVLDDDIPRFAQVRRQALRACQAPRELRTVGP